MNKTVALLFPLILLTGLVVLAQMPDSLSGLDQPRNYQSQRSSSSAADWQKSNDDRISVAPGQTITLLDVPGSGQHCPHLVYHRCWRAELCAACDFTHVLGWRERSIGGGAVG